MNYELTCSLNEMQDFEPCYLASAAADDQLEEDSWGRFELPAPLVTRLPNAAGEDQIADCISRLANGLVPLALQRSPIQEKAELYGLAAKR